MELASQAQVVVLEMAVEWVWEVANPVIIMSECVVM